ncbi:MAG: VCBS repeat-containing protein [Armatimonadetes bacterium]|nr:VCBS repeat-containing protein [Armatimonadota bacterium]
MLPAIVDLTTAPANLPLIQPAAIIRVEPAWAGAWTTAGDVDGDGRAEIVQARIDERDDTHAVVAVSVYRQDGTVLWRWGNPAAGVAALHSDVPCQVHDWNRDGRPEVVVGTRTAVITLDGASGHELERFATPGPDAVDCLVFARLSGAERDDLLIKTRYQRLWAYTAAGRLLWTINEPGGQRTAHQPLVFDLDGDGRDEVLAGYELLGHDGQVRWTLDVASLSLGRGHLDCARVMRTGATPADWRLVLTCCGDQQLLCMDGAGKVIWRQTGRHFESLHLADFAGLGEGQILVDIDHTERSRAPMEVYAADGTTRVVLNTTYGRFHPVLTWGDDPTPRLVACEDRLLVSGADGRPLARFATPTPDDVAFDQSANAAEHRAMGDYHLIGQVGNLFGQGQPDLMLHSNPGGMIWLYRNPARARGSLAPGLGPNVTLY